jgi:hypothetical protein
MAYSAQYLSCIARTDPVLAQQMSVGVVSPRISFIVRWMASNTQLSDTRNLSPREVVRFERWGP